MVMMMVMMSNTKYKECVNVKYEWSYIHHDALDGWSEVKWNGIEQESDWCKNNNNNNNKTRMAMLNVECTANNVLYCIVLHCIVLSMY